jgi:hypothetical protein
LEATTTKEKKVVSRELQSPHSFASSNNIQEKGKETNNEF